MNFSFMLGVVNAIVFTFAMFGIGALCVKLGYIRKSSVDGWSNFTISVLSPCLIFSSVTAHIDFEELLMIWQLPATGFGIVAFNCLLGYFVVRAMRIWHTDRRGTIWHMLSTNNFLFLPIVILQGLWGERAAAINLVMHVGSVLGLWTIGIAVLSTSDWKQLARKIISPNFIAVITGIVCVAFDKYIRVPGIVMQVTRQLGAMTVPLSCIVIGATMYMNLHQLFENLLECSLVVISRLIVLPVITICLLSVLPLCQDYKRVAIVVASMPASCLSILVMRRYDGRPELAGQIIFFSTLFSVITVPIVLYLAL